MNYAAPKEGCLSLAEVSGAVGKTRPTVWRWIKDGKLPAVKDGSHYYIERDTLVAFLGVAEATRCGLLTFDDAGTDDI